MKARSSTLWTIQQLCDEVARALAVGYAGTPNGRVRDVPDLRTIRYYTTIGLLDRPAEMRGRTALYGPRHLLQLVAIKKLQARGQSLSQIQQAMAGATDAMLRRLAGEMAGRGGEPTDEPTTAGQPVKPRPFWKRPARSPLDSRRARRPDSRPLEPKAGAATCPEPTELLQAIALVDRVMLLLAPARAVDARRTFRDPQGRGPLDSMSEETPVDPTNLEGRR